MNFLLSPSGTSVLTNRAGDKRFLLSNHANAKKKEDVPRADQEIIDGIIHQARESLKSANIQEAALRSAELNGLLSYYNHVVEAGSGDHHLILCTDTWLGMEAAQLIEEKLKQWGFTVEIKRQPDLQTQDLPAFQQALCDLVSWCEETLPGYRQARYHIVFNLTGGFKSVQGFLQTLALFYADETIYIFETGDNLLRIPRMPVRMAAEESLREHLETFRRLANGLGIAGPQGVPEAFLFQVDGEYALNAWGELTWKQTYRQLYGEKLCSSPSARIRYGKDFEKSVAEHAPNAERRIMVNEKIDQLARHLESENYNPPSLDFKLLRANPLPPSTHEMDAWADQDAKRMFGHFENQVFILDKLGKALH